MKQVKHTFFYILEISLLFIAVLLFWLFWIKKEDYSANNFSDAYVSCREAIAELTFSVYTQEEWEAFLETFDHPYLTNEMVGVIIKKLGASEVISYTLNRVERPISREDWSKLYEELLAYLDVSNQVEIVELFVLGCESKDNQTLLKTDQGTFYTTLPLTFFHDFSSYRCYVTKEECLGVHKKLPGNAVLSNALVLQQEENKISFLFDGSCYEMKASMEKQVSKDTVCDLIWEHGKLSAVHQKQDYIIGKLLSFDENRIEIEGYGRLAKSKRLPVYKNYDEPEELSIHDVIIGNMQARYILGENEVCAIVITSPPVLENVRVLLLAEDGTKFQKEVSFYSKQPFTVTYNDKIYQIPEDTIFTVDHQLEGIDTLMVTPMDENQGIYFYDKKEQKSSHAYFGHIEIRKYQEGYCVVNDLPLETYLYAVVPSEMPSNYDIESLKAQAVCARSYAYIQVMRADLAAYGAHINDSTSYQVYNKVAPTNQAKMAVDATRGEVLMYQGDVIEAFYFSTSCGYTDTACVWNGDDAEYGYLKPVCLNKETFTGDLSKEADFNLYLRENSEAFDSNIKYYRWRITADYCDCEKELIELLENRKKAVDKHITFMNKEGTEPIEHLKKAGKWKGFTVLERSASGSILSLEIEFEHAMVTVKNEYNIRKVLGLGAKSIQFQDGSNAQASSLLPSAFCTIEKQKDGSYLLYGGGFGHGIGMSQNGANGMAKAGYHYRDILQYFYKDIEFAVIGE